MTWGDRPDKEEYDRAQAALNAHSIGQLNIMMAYGSPVRHSPMIAAAGVGFAQSVMSQAALAGMSATPTLPQLRVRNAQAYAAGVRARNPSMQVKRLTEPMP